MLISICALACGILAGLGVGSGGVFVVCLALFCGYPQLYSQSLNLIFFVASSVAAVIINLIKGRLSLKLVLAVAIPGCIGSVGGAMIAHQIGSGLLSKLFGGVLILCGVISLLSGKREKDSQR